MDFASVVNRPMIVDTKEKRAVGCDASEADQHTAAENAHRVLARKARSMDECVAHHAAADAHALAASSPTAENSFNAREASQYAHKLAAMYADSQ